jgi:regulator of protease activity HflC (stomatin/prohibitin superfamily)
MILFVVGILVALIASGVAAYFLSNSKKGRGVVTLSLGLAVGVVLVVISCFTTIPTGYTGIVTTFGRVEDITLEAGINAKAPWQKIIKMDNRNQKAVIDMVCFSSDIQEVSIKYSVNYQINKETASTIYRTIGTDYYNTVMLPRIEEAVKSVIARFTAETLIENRTQFSTEIYSVLMNDLSVYNIKIITASVEDIDFTDAFTNAVEAKQVAAQKKLQAEIEQAQKTMEQEAEAQRSVVQANAAAEVSVIQAEANLEITKIQADAAEYAGQKDAAVNNAIAASLTPELLYYYYIKGWDGKLPSTYISQEDFNSLFEVQAGNQ